MTCEDCKRPYTYSYHINTVLWVEATGGILEGHLCAHCILERLGGIHWHIMFNEGAATMDTSNPYTSETNRP